MKENDHDQEWQKIVENFENFFNNPSKEEIAEAKLEDYHEAKLNDKKLGFVYDN